MLDSFEAIPRLMYMYTVEKEKKGVTYYLSNKGGWAKNICKAEFFGSWRSADKAANWHRRSNKYMISVYRYRLTLGTF